MNRHSDTPATERTQAARGADRFAGMRQRLYPKHLLSWMMLGATRIRFAAVEELADSLVHTQVRRGSETSSADPDSASYPHFNAFFTRALTSGHPRPVEGGPRTVVARLRTAPSPLLAR